MSAAIIEQRLVRDPLMTDAEYWHKKNRHPNKPNIGLILVDVNLKSYIGGFWRYGKRTEAQTHAAARFKAIYEACQIGGARCVNYEDPRVDVSHVFKAMALERGERARADYMAAVQALGMRWSALVESVVVYDRSQNLIAQAYGYGEGRTGRRRVQEQVYIAMDTLARHFHY